METITISLAGWLLALAALCWGQFRHDKRRAAERSRALAAVGQGVTLMTAIQQHRGMAAALLNGDDSFAVKLAGKQQEVEHALTTLGDSFCQITAFSVLERRLETIRTDWQTLRSQVSSFTSEKSFTSHTSLIQQVLYLLGDMGERGGLLEAHAPNLAALADILLLRIPPLTESIGQARALGTGFAAKGSCGAVGRVRLHHLERRIGDLMAGIMSEQQQLSTREQECRYKVNVLLALIETRLVGTEQIDLSPEQYFRTATDAIDACLALWHTAEQATLQALSSPNRESSTKRSAQKLDIRQLQVRENT
jgi:hypothetical protein